MKERMTKLAIITLFAASTIFSPGLMTTISADETEDIEEQDTKAPQQESEETENQLNEAVETTEGASENELSEEAAQEQNEEMNTAEESTEETVSEETAETQDEESAPKQETKASESHLEPAEPEKDDAEAAKEDAIDDRQEQTDENREETEQADDFLPGNGTDDEGESREEESAEASAEEQTGEEPRETPSAEEPSEETTEDEAGESVTEQPLEQPSTEESSEEPADETVPEEPTEESTDEIPSEEEPSEEQPSEEPTEEQMEIPEETTGERGNDSGAEERQGKREIYRYDYDMLEGISLTPGGSEEQLQLLDKRVNHVMTSKIVDVEDMSEEEIMQIEEEVKQGEQISRQTGREELPNTGENNQYTYIYGVVLLIAGIILYFLTRKPRNQ